MGAAAATGLTMVLALLLSSIYVRIQYGLLPSLKSAARIALCSLILFAAGSIIQTRSLPLLLVELPGLGLLYLISLKLSGELSHGEMEKIRQLLKLIRDHSSALFTTR